MNVSVQWQLFVAGFCFASAGLMAMDACIRQSRSRLSRSVGGLQCELVQFGYRPVRRTRRTRSVSVERGAD